jgi:hypothetical protein
MWISGKLALSGRSVSVIKSLIFRSMVSAGVFYRKFGIFYFIPVAGWDKRRRDGRSREERQ